MRCDNNPNFLIQSAFYFRRGMHTYHYANSIFGNKIAYFREKYRIQHDFSNLNNNNNNK